MSESTSLSSGIYNITSKVDPDGRPVGRREFVKDAYPAPFPAVVIFPTGARHQRWEIKEIGRGLYILEVLPEFFPGSEPGKATNIDHRVYAVPINEPPPPTVWRIVKRHEYDNVYNIFTDSPIRPTPGWVVPADSDLTQIIVRPIELGNLPQEQFVIVRAPLDK